MADRKITDLTALAAGSQATGDLLTIVDVSESAAADKNKKITVENLFKGIPGDVGIGTASPAHAVHIAGATTPELIVEDTTNNVKAVVGADNSVGRIGTDTNHDLTLRTNDTERVRIDSSGRLLVGTTTEGNGDADDLTVATSGNTGITVRSGTANTGNLYFSDATSGTAEFAGAVTYNHSSNDLRFRTNTTENVVIDSSGRLLIGTSSGTDTGSESNLIIESNSSGATSYGGLMLRRGGTGIGSGTSLGRIYFADQNGNTGARISALGDGTWATDDYPGVLVFDTTPDGSSSFTERMRIDSSGNVGIGHNSPASLLTVGGDVITTTKPTVSIAPSSGNGSITIRGGSPILSFDQTGGGDGTIIYDSSSDLIFKNGTLDSSSEVARFDDSGRLLINHSSSISSAGVTSQLQVTGDTAATGSIAIRRDANSTSGPILIFGKSRSGALGNNVSVNNGDNVGSIVFAAADGTDVSSQCAEVKAQIDGTPGSNDTPGRLVFMTASDGSNAPSERMRIQANGNILMGKTSPSITTPGHEFFSYGSTYITTNTQIPLYINRQSTDGTLISFRHSNTQEGSISVSGSTVSYNGAHLARWSQLAGGAERTEILRGSVMSNLDEMCEWAYEAQDAVLYTEDDELPEGASVGDVKEPARAAGTEDNEQLNRMKVSDVEGDVNVSGVFQAWDDNDDTYTNDFYCAMTGDFVIRIAQGTTVARGDLLMSAGDGTAKPQDDDIVRSKTIAKVTSTTVSTTYADGSYCVPCVLMAC